MLPRPLAVVPAVLVLPLAIAACGSSGTPSGGGASSRVAVTASDSACSLGTPSVPAGSTTFDVTNTGEQVTEVYVYAKDGDAFSVVVAEVENIGPGTTRDMTVDLTAGAYEVACKPGQTGDGLRTPLAVTGESVAPTSASAARQITLTIAASDRLTGVDGQTATVGEQIEFIVTNSAAGKRVFEVKRPDGSVAGEIDIAASADGELGIDATVAGDWTLIVEGGPKETATAFTVN